MSSRKKNSKIRDYILCKAEGRWEHYLGKAPQLAAQNLVCIGSDSSKYIANTIKDISNLILKTLKKLS
jgi:hypothetical protein